MLFTLSVSTADAFVVLAKLSKCMLIKERLELLFLAYIYDRERGIVKMS